VIRLCLDARFFFFYYHFQATIFLFFYVFSQFIFQYKALQYKDKIILIFHYLLFKFYTYKKDKKKMFNVWSIANDMKIKRRQ